MPGAFINLTTKNSHHQFLSFATKLMHWHNSHLSLLTQCLFLLNAIIYYLQCFHDDDVPMQLLSFQNHDFFSIIDKLSTNASHTTKMQSTWFWLNLIYHKVFYFHSQKHLLWQQSYNVLLHTDSYSPSCSYYDVSIISSNLNLQIIH